MTHTNDTNMRLSVLIPTFNYGQYIGSAVSSVLDQQMDSVEIIVVDDGSTDETPEILRPWSEAGLIRCLTQANGGPSAARNLALANAQGEFVMFLDADDALMPGCLEATLGFLERHPEVDLFFTNYDIFDDDGIVTSSGVDTWRVFRTIPHREVEPGGWIFSETLTPYIIRHGSFMHTSGLTLRRSVAGEAGPFREGYSYGEDDEFYARAAYGRTSGYMDRVLSRKRSHSRSLTRDLANQLRNAKHLLELTEIQREHYRGNPALQRILRVKARTCAGSYVWGLIQSGNLAGARAIALKYLREHPFYWPLYRLLLRTIVRGERQRAPV